MFYEDLTVNVLVSSENITKLNHILIALKKIMIVKVNVNSHLS